MKIRLTLEFPDPLRRYIGSLIDAKDRTENHLAIRAACEAWLHQRLLEAIASATAWVPPDEPSEVDLHETREATEYLRAAGWTESKIRNWVLCQRALIARMEFGIGLKTDPKPPVPRGTSPTR